MTAKNPSPDPSHSPSSYPLKPIQYNGEKSSVVQTTQTNQTKNDLDRISTSFYLNEELNTAWRRYCRLSEKDGCWILEEALLDYMRAHPNPQVSLTVTQDLRALTPTLQERLRCKILRDKIDNVVKILRRLDEKGLQGNRNGFRKELQKLVLQATKLKHPDPELLDVLRESEDLL